MTEPRIDVRLLTLSEPADWLLTLLVAKRGGVLYLPIVGRHW